MTTRPRWAREAGRRRVPAGAGASVDLRATCGPELLAARLHRGPDGRVWLEWHHNGHVDYRGPLDRGLVDYLRAVVR